MSTLLAWTRNRLCRNFVDLLPPLKNMRLQSKLKSSNIISESSKVASEEMNGKDDGTCEPKKNGDFSNFRISSKTVKKLQERGITHLFPIQARTYDYVYDGCDIIARAKTGTGKTLSFALPLCEKLREIKQVKDKGRPPMVLTLAPTRELANQILKEFELIKSKKLSTICVYGGVSYDSQEAAFRNGLDILVGTPGRIFDHMERGNLDLSKLKHVVLDEADRMLEMGFQEKVDEILKNAYTQGKPQTLLFSATVPTWVSKASKKYMGEDKKLVDLVGEEGDQTACGVEHKALRCPYHERAATIADIVQVYSGAHGRAMIFTSTKKEANELALNSVLKQETQVLHGDINQAQREITLSSFREGKIRVLVATDVASRGLDIPEVDLVIQTEPPADIESYIHRSGRTGRAGRTGVCIVFYKPNQEYLLQAVEKQAGIKFMRIGAPQPSDIIKASAKDATRSLETVSTEMASLFESTAKDLLETNDAVKVLSKALALVSGNTEIKTRSLLSSQAGYTTFLIRQNWQLRGTGLIWKMLNDDFSSKDVDQIRGMKLCKDKLAAVFDVPDALKNTFKDNWKERHYATLEIPTSLPELEDRKPDSYGYGNRGGNSWNSRGSGTFHSKPRFGNQGNQGFKRKNDNNSNRDWNDRKRTKYGASA